MKTLSILSSIALASLVGLVSSPAFASVMTFNFNMPGLGTGDVYGDQTVANTWSRPSGVVATAEDVVFGGYSGIQGNGSAFGFPNAPNSSDTATAFLQYYNGAPAAPAGSIELIDNTPLPTATLTFTEVNRPNSGTLTFEVLQGANVLQTFTGQGGWTTYAVPYTPMAGESITFEAISSSNGSDGSVALTNVSISAVPELSTWALMLAGFAALGLVGYRRTRAADSLA